MIEQLFNNWVVNAHGIPAYCGILGVLIACGLGLPVPEDISLVTGGFLAHLGHAHLYPMMAVGFLGILTGDSIIYFAGRRLGSKVGQREEGFFARIVTPEKRARVQQLFKAHGQKIVMLARFLPGVRAVTFFTAGSARMSYLKFVLWDGLAALVSAPLLVFLGFKFGDELDWIIHKVRQGQTRVIAIILIAVVAYVIYSLYRNAQLRRRGAQAISDGSVDPSREAADVTSSLESGT